MCGMMLGRGIGLNIVWASSVPLEASAVKKAAVQKTRARRQLWRINDLSDIEFKKIGDGSCSCANRGDFSIGLINRGFLPP